MVSDHYANTVSWKFYQCGNLRLILVEENNNDTIWTTQEAEDHTYGEDPATSEIVSELKVYAKTRILWSNQMLWTDFEISWFSSVFMMIHYKVGPLQSCETFVR